MACNSVGCVGQHKYRERRKIECMRENRYMREGGRERSRDERREGILTRWRSMIRDEIGSVVLSAKGNCANEGEIETYQNAVDWRHQRWQHE